jgi:hypothetical protein
MSDDTLNAYVIKQAATMGRRLRQVPRRVWIPRMPEAEGHYLGVLRLPDEGFRGTDVREFIIGPDSQTAILRTSNEVGCVDLTTSTVRWRSNVGLGQYTHIIRLRENPPQLLITGVREAYLIDPISGDKLDAQSRTNYVGQEQDPRLATPSRELVQLMQAFQKVASQRILIQGLDMSWDDQLVVSGDMNGYIDVFDISSGLRKSEFRPHSSAVWGLRYSPDDQRMLAVYHDGTVLILDATTGEVLLRCFERDSVRGFDWSPNGNLFVTVSSSLEGSVRDGRTGKEVFRFAPTGCVHLSWSRNGGFIATCDKAGYDAPFLRFWNVQHLLPQDVVQSDGSVPVALDKSQEQLVSGLLQLHRLNIYPTLALFRDLLDLTAGRPVYSAVTQLLTEPNSRIPEIVALQWPTPARVGLVALLLHNQSLSEWQPPRGYTADILREALCAALTGEEVEPTTPPIPVSLLKEAAKLITDQLLTLLSLLGPEAVAADPGLPLRLLSRVPELPALSAPDRRLLGMRVRAGGRSGHAVGNSEGAERARVGGVESGPHADWTALLPSQLALPPEVLTYRHLRGELLFRAREVAEPPRLRPVVLLLDVSPPTFGPVESITRLAAFITGRTLQQAGVESILVTTGRWHGDRELVHELRNPADLVEVWTQRTLKPANVLRSLRLAVAVRDNLRGDDAQEPLVLLMTHAWFGAEDQMDIQIGHIRGLFVQYRNQHVRPALAKLCERWESVGSGIDAGNLGERLGYLLG